MPHGNGHAKTPRRESDGALVLLSGWTPARGGYGCVSSWTEMPCRFAWKPCQGTR